MSRGGRRGKPRAGAAGGGRRRIGESVGEGLLSALDLLRARRLPYGEALASAVSRTVRQFPPLAGKLIVEVGAGTGQLASWLPADAAWCQTVHTDLSPAAVHRMDSAPSEPSEPASAIASAPTRGSGPFSTPSRPSRALVASATALPFADASCGMVLGLCVFDALSEPQQTAAVREVARVLAPGGRFVHFLDMATLLEAPFRRLVESKLVPLPNLFGDPADEEWPLDIILVERDWLAGLLDFAVRTAHPLAAGFAHDLALFLEPSGRFRVQAATDRWKAIASDGERRRALATSFRAACNLAFKWGYPAISPLPFHSGKYLASVMQTAFLADGAFRIALCEIRAEASFRPELSGEGPRYQSLCLGHQRVMDRLPKRLLSETARTWLASPDGSPEGKPGHTLIEVGVLVFVAERAA